MWHFPEAPVGSSSLSVTMSSMATFLTWPNRQVDVIKLNWLESQFNPRLSECKAANPLRNPLRRDRRAYVGG